MKRWWGIRHLRYWRIKMRLKGLEDMGIYISPSHWRYLQAVREGRA